MQNTAISVFLALNIAILVGTAVWFRFDHASSSRRFQDETEDTLVAEVMWQYSLRSNLLLFGCALASYLLYIDEIKFLLVCFACFSILNIVTDSVYRYEGSPIFTKVKKGHQIAAGVICVVSIIFLLYG